MCPLKCWRVLCLWRESRPLCNRFYASSQCCSEELQPGPCPSSSPLLSLQLIGTLRAHTCSKVLGFRV